MQFLFIYSCAYHYARAFENKRKLFFQNHNLSHNNRLPHNLNAGDDPSVLELDVEVLIDRVERATDGQIVLELHCHFLPHELLEVGEEIGRASCRERVSSPV